MEIRFLPTVDIAPIALPPSIPHTIPLQNEQGSIIGFGGTGSGSTSVERLQRGHQRVTDNARYIMEGLKYLLSQNFFFGSTHACKIMVNDVVVNHSHERHFINNLSDLNTKYCWGS